MISDLRHVFETLAWLIVVWLLLWAVAIWTLPWRFPD